MKRPNYTHSTTKIIIFRNPYYEQKQELSEGHQTQLFTLLDNEQMSNAKYKVTYSFL
jgi:hypothetical protein